MSTAGSWTGTATLVRVAARRDRVMVGVWLGILVLAVAASGGSISTLYATEAERISAATAINTSPGLVALYGPILDPTSVGELAMTKMTVLYGAIISIMMLFIVRRHTRLDEENGQAELLAGTAIGQDAQLGAAVVFGVIVSGVLGLLAALVNVGTGLPVLGSFAFGASWTASGLVGVGLAALACQLSASARTCAGIASAWIGVEFVLRAVGDTSSASWLSWLTPLGWNTKLRAWGDTRWWLLLLYGAAAVILVMVAVLVRNRRDLGSGIMQTRPGPATGSPRLRDAIALAFRVHAPMLMWWTISMAAAGLTFGAISPSLDGFDSPQMREMFARLGGEGTLRDTLLAALASLLGLVIAAFAVAVITHVGNDEIEGRTEQVLATKASRGQVFLASGLVAGAGALWLLLVTGVGLALGVGNDTNHSLGSLVVATVSQAPAVWVVAGVGTLLVSLRSGWAALGWAGLVFFALLGQIGELLNLPRVVLQLSPYSHIPRMPVESFSATPLWVLTAVSAAVLGVAWTRYRVRDIG